MEMVVAEPNWLTKDNLYQAAYELGVVAYYDDSGEMFWAFPKNLSRQNLLRCRPVRRSDLDDRSDEDIKSVAIGMGVERPF